ncbi:MAG TPA: MarR family transcriptional regulator [Afipia sp.]
MALSHSFIQTEIGLLVTRVGRLWRRQADQALAEHGLSEATAIPLMVLFRRGKSMRQGLLADEIGVEGPSLVRLVDLLEGEGLVERREDHTDRRAKVLHLTPAGEAKAEEIERVMRRVRSYLLKGIPHEHLALTFEVLRSIENRTGMLAAAAAAEAV